MNPRKYTLVIPDAHSGKRLDQVIADWLPEAAKLPLSKAKARKLIQAGAVFLNGSLCRIASKPVRFKARLEVFLDPKSLAEGDEALGNDREFELTDRDVVFEDEWIVVINKPYGLPTQPTLDRSRANLFDLLKRYLGARERKTEAYVGLHHRLDRDTSGVILFTKKKEANFGVSEIFKQHLARKTYLAVIGSVGKGLPNVWRVENYLAKARGTGKQAKMCSVRSGGDPAQTDFRILSRSPSAFLVQCEPRTGRMHQIRVHLSEGGHPILGDATYGDRSTASRLMLHAFSLTFPHPVTKLETTVRAPIPQDLSKCLQAHLLPLPPELLGPT